MKKPSIIHGFLMLYIGLIAVSYFANQFIFNENFTLSGVELFTVSIAQSSLTQIIGNAFSTHVSDSYILFSLSVTQLSGIIFLSYLLWFYWRLFNPEKEGQNLKDAFRLTIKIVFISELLLTIFFLYSLSSELENSSFSHKILAALTLAIGSFNNAGFTHIDIIPPNIIQHKFIIQIGIVAGSTLGSLGVFVIDELFSPKKLRERLHNPEIDWSLITKVSVFGVAIIFAVFSGIYIISETNGHLADKNIIESVIAGIYEISSARGFGHYLTENSPDLLKIISSSIGAGPFSTGGGLTLLSLVLIYSFFFKSQRHVAEIKKVQKLSKNLILVLLSSFGIILLTILIIYLTTNDHFSIINSWMLFNTNQFLVLGNSSWHIEIIQWITNFVGRIGFIAACYLTLKQKSRQNASSLF